MTYSKISSSIIHGMFEVNCKQGKFAVIFPTF